MNAHVDWQGLCQCAHEDICMLLSYFCALSRLDTYLWTAFTESSDCDTKLFHAISFFGLFINSVYCANVARSKVPRCTSLFQLFTVGLFKRPNQKLWTSSRETGPKHPEEPFCLTFIHSCSFSRVPPESIWQTLVKKKKEFQGRKTTSRSWATHTPSAVVLSSFIIYRLCALILFLQFGLLVIVVVVLVVFCLWSTVIWDSDGERRGPPPCASNRPFRTLLMACQFPLPFHFLSN